MPQHTLFALSPLDGRYQEKLAGLREIFSEYGLIRARFTIEIKWFLFLNAKLTLTTNTKLTPTDIQLLEDLSLSFNAEDALRIKEIEASTNHDVKAVEYFIKEKCKLSPTLDALNEFIHFGCTSEDINNLAYALMLQKARNTCVLPALQALICRLSQMAHDFADIAMLARTHGQAATPTTLGKELANVVARLKRQIKQLENVEILGKLNGATGNYSALQVSYPETDWPKLSKTFIEALDLTFNSYTTQIEPHDALAEFFSVLLRINTILIDFTRDTWGYIALHYFTQKSLAHEVGSSTMPHKINPIDFENAEGNLGIANALLSHFIEKLPISRFQRDLSDSTVLRNIGSAFAYSLLAYQSTLKGLDKLAPNRDFMQQELNAHWEVLGEAIQTVMRRYQLANPYEALKDFTRGKVINQETLHAFIHTLSLPSSEKQRLLQLTPATYIGYAKALALDILS